MPGIKSGLTLCASTLTLLGIVLIVPHIGADVNKTYNDIDYLASGVQLLRWSVEVYRYTDGVPEHTCSGSLVKPAVVISAARCFWGKEGQLPASQFVVTQTFEGNHRDYPLHSLWESLVGTIHLPPSFRDLAGLYEDDIAVLKLVTPFRGATPICVNFADDLDKRQLAEGNFGRTMGTLNEPGHGRRPSPLFTVLEVPFVSRERCANQSEPYFREQLTPDKICAEYPPGPFDSFEFQICRGDHGSGLAFHSGSSIPYLRGVASIPAPDPSDPYWTLSKCSKLWSQFLTLSPRERDELRVALEGCPEPRGIRFAAFTHIASQRAFLERHVPDLEAVCGQYYTTADADHFECNCHCN